MAFTERLTRNVDMTAWHGKIPVHYRYTLGLAGEKFFTALKKDGKFLATRCDRCGITYAPPSVYCERCFDALDTWIELPPTGTLMSFTVVTEDSSGHALKEPQIIGAVQLDGADTVLIHRICPHCVDCLCPGARVKAVLLEKKKRAGGINDIVHFEILE
jgi:uncharacterized OB-fold protein